MVKFLHATLWVTVVHHCHPMKAPEKKKLHENVLFVSDLKNWNIPLFIITMFNWNFVFISLENSVILFFMIKPYHWHWFLTYIIIQTLEGIADFWNRKCVTRQGYQLNHELHPGINFPKGKLIENCKNNLYIYPCNQETNTIFLISTFIFLMINHLNV